MKKIMFAVMAMCAIGFTACGNKAQAPAENEETVETMVYNAEEEAAASINQLTEQIEAQDASKFQEVLAAIQEKIKAFAGENEAVQTALAALTAAPADTVVDGLMQALNGAKDAAEGAVDAVQDAAEGAVDAAKDAAENAAENAKDAAKEKAGEAVDAAADQAKKALGI